MWEKASAYCLCLKQKRSCSLCRNSQKSISTIQCLIEYSTKHITKKISNTFGIDVNAKRFVVIDSFEQLKELLIKEKDLFLLSGGSNMLLTKDIEQLVVHINIKGISIDAEDENHVYLTVSAGEDWHEFVLWCIDNDYGGLENLSLIPGNVGTSLDSKYWGVWSRGKRCNNQGSGYSD